MFITCYYVMCSIQVYRPRTIGLECSRLLFYNMHTCTFMFSYCRNSVETRLRCSLLNCAYTLQVLQQVATNDYNPNSRCITQTVKQGCASVHIVKQQTATFQTYGPGSVRLYATHDILTCFIHIDVYNLDLRILTYTPV